MRTWQGSRDHAILSTRTARDGLIKSSSVLAVFRWMIQLTNLGSTDDGLICQGSTLTQDSLTFTGPAMSQDHSPTSHPFIHPHSGCFPTFLSCCAVTRPQGGWVGGDEIVPGIGLVEDLGMVASELACVSK